MTRIYEEYPTSDLIVYHDNINIVYFNCCQTGALFFNLKGLKYLCFVENIFEPNRVVLSMFRT